MAELTFVDKSTVKLVSTHGSDDDVCYAAWVSNNEFGKNPDHQKPFSAYGEDMEKWDKKTQGLINFLYENRHMSPFEHTHMKFYIETPIFVTREFMRHRTWSYNEMSGRYMELPGRMFLIEDDRPIVKKGKTGHYTFEAGTDEQYGIILAETSMAYTKSWRAYQKMIEAGVANEVARNVLPVGTMTQFYATANIRNIMLFLQLRNDKHALKEIRDVAVQIEEQFEKKFPKVYSAYKKFDWRAEKDELETLRKRVAELEALVPHIPQYDYTINANVDDVALFDVPNLSSIKVSK